MVNLLYVVLRSLLSCLIPLANLLGMVVVCQLLRNQPQLRLHPQPAHADLLVGVTCFTGALGDVLHSSDQSESLCLLRVAVSVTPCIGSILTLLLISLDRYLAVMLPLSYSALLKKTPVVLSLLALWTLSFFFGHLPLILPSLQRGNYTGYCGLLYVAKSEYLYVICFGIFTPSLRALLCLHVWVGSVASLQHGRLCRGGARARPPRLRRCKALRTVLIVLTGFSLSWGPYLVGGTVQATCSSCNLVGPLEDTLFLLGETNSLINPLIYALHCRDIRSHLAKLLGCGTQGQVKPPASNVQTVGSWGRSQTEAPGS